MKNLILLFAFGLMFSCSKDNNTVTPKEEVFDQPLTERSKTWINSLQADKILVFQNANGQSQNFVVQDVTDKAKYEPAFLITREKGILVKSQMKIIAIKNTATNENLVVLRAIGDGKLDIYFKQDQTDFWSYTITLRLSDYTSPQEYWGGWGGDPNLANATYKYGSLYPKLGSDVFDMSFSTPSTKLKKMVLEQNKGVMSFTDEAGLIWKLKE